MRGLFFLLAPLLLALFPGGVAVAQMARPPAGTSAPGDRGTAATKKDAASSLISKAEGHIVQREYGQAVPLLKHAIAASGVTRREIGRAWYDRGYIQQAQGHAAAAEKDFRKAIAADPKQFESPAALGRMLASQRKWKAARKELQAAAKLQPASGNRGREIAEVDRMLARVNARLGDAPAASDALLAALKLTPETNADTLLAAQLAEASQNDADAVREYRKALAADPKSEAAAEGLARTLVHQGNYAEAEPVLRKALQLKPNDPSLLAELATVFSHEGKTKEALAQLEALHGLEPKQAAVTRMLADLYSDSGQPKKAEPLYRKLLKADPKNTDLLTAQGENFLRQRKWRKAAASFRKSLQLKPDQGDAWSALAFADSENRHYAAVLTALDNRVKYSPEVPATVFLRATALDHLHRTGEAIPLYRKFLREGKGTFPDEEKQTRKRLAALGKKP